MMEPLRRWARAAKAELLALWLAAQDRRAPWVARGVALITAAYAFSPIDLIPDFIPVLGLFDDLILLPLGVMLAVRLIPPALMAEFRAGAQELAERPTSKGAAAAILALWLILAIIVGLWLWSD